MGVSLRWFMGDLGCVIFCTFDWERFVGEDFDYG